MAAVNLRIISLVLAICCHFAQGTILPVVATNDGPLVGSFGTTVRKHRAYVSYQGIKYAEVPERFQLSTPVRPWSEIQSATEVGPRCPGINIIGGAVFEGSEDCLYLNVFAPVNRENLPVIFMVHGGAYAGGASQNYGPGFLLDEEVVLVTVNYRLGIFGFLNLEDGSIPANVGLKDLILALKWVQRNIGAFGGDPGRVTLIGQSAGAMLNHVLALSPATKGLFHRVILQSGSALSGVAIISSPRQKTVDFAKTIGCTSTSSQELIDCLRKAPVKALFSPDLPTEAMKGRLVAIFGPTVESSISASPDDFKVLPEKPYKLALAGAGSHLPMIVGSVAFDGLLLNALPFALNQTVLAYMMENFPAVATHTFGFDKYVPLGDLPKFTSKLKDIYFKEFPGVNPPDSVIRLHQDMNFDRAVHLTVATHSKNGGQVFPYSLTFQGDFSGPVALGIPLTPFRPTHADELMYLYSPCREQDLPFPQPKSGTDSDKFSKKLVSLFVSFARDGKPDFSWGDKWEHVDAKAAERGEYPKLHIHYPRPKSVKNERELRRISALDKLLRANKDIVVA